MTGDLITEDNFIWYFLWLDKKGWLFSEDDCLIEVTLRTS